MQLVFDDAVLFRRCVESISALIDEAVFSVTSNSIELRATDPSNIALVDFSLPKEAFSSYEVNEKINLGLDFVYLTKILKRAKAGEQLIISLKPGSTSFDLILKSKSSRKFSIPLIDITNKEIPELNIDFDFIVILEANLIQDALKDAQLFSSHLIISASNDSISFKASSSRGSLNSVIEKTECKKIDSKTDFLQVMFPLDYLNDLLCAASSNDLITIKLKEKAPLMLSYNVGQATINYFLAPRLEGE